MSGILQEWYTDTFTCLRRTTTSSITADSVTTADSGVGLLRPVRDIAELFVATNLGKEYDFLCDEDKDIQTGDDLVVNGSIYTVQGVSKYEDLEGDIESHLDIRVNTKNG